MFHYRGNSQPVMTVASVTQRLFIRQPISTKVHIAS
ncbi:hypothetical protein GBAR_LOCUS9522 [Geodia barretti]|uniref:Uncharacterized protein n=1 Tax=Geodia barretti TaxID=519541 RepID=A0AA35RR65_GEOBA|nr:hypothetical protein GBAR_LOCUS9522 [Geodia barretti]